MAWILEEKVSSYNTVIRWLLAQAFFSGHHSLLDSSLGHREILPVRHAGMDLLYDNRSRKNRNGILDVFDSPATAKFSASRVI